MKAFTINETIVTYDIFIETICEAALIGLLRGQLNPDRSKAFYEEELERLHFGQLEALSEEDPLQKERKSLKSNLENWIKEPKVENELNAIIKTKNGEQVPISNNIVDNLWLEERMVGPTWIKSVWHSPLVLYLCLRLGYVVDLGTGILEGLQANKINFFKEILNVWLNAAIDLHPFQHGPTHQGSKHCIQVHNNLCALKEFLEGIDSNGIIKNIKDEEWGLLSIAAALHDIGKGDIIVPRGLHAINGATAIRKTSPDNFKIDKGYNKFVATIVDTHAPDDRKNMISKVDESPYIIQNVGGVCNKDTMQAICSLFHLADVMDTTRDRVSEPFLAMLRTLYGSSNKPPLKKAFDNIEQLDNARKGMISLKILPNEIEVSLSKDDKLAQEAKKRIKKENADLNKTGAQDILISKNWPHKLTPPKV